MNNLETALKFKALGDEIRLNILELIKEKEYCVCDLTDALKIKQPAVSYHIKILCDAKLIKCRNDGKWTYYSIAITNYKELIKYLIDLSI